MESFTWREKFETIPRLMPFIGLMVLSIVLLAFFPDIALWLPNNVK